MQDVILHIDTSSARGLVMISRAGKPVAMRTNLQAFDHAAFLQPAILEIMDEIKAEPQNIAAIAVANGPGSYTGLRVGLASAKGLCFAWQKPLITISSLQLMSLSIALNKSKHLSHASCIVPMIDARRMEVFYGIYDADGITQLASPKAAIVDENFLINTLNNSSIIFTGDGSIKWKNICNHPNAFFEELPDIDDAFAKQGYHLYNEHSYADLVYSEPFYIKSFYTTYKKTK